MGNQTIDGLGTKAGVGTKGRISKRAIAGKLDVKKQMCPFCKHHKVFIGNSQGQAIKKCCKCKQRII